MLLGQDRDFAAEVIRRSHYTHSVPKEHKITPAEVGHIKHKRIWKHVDGPIVFGNKRCKLTDEEILAIYRDPRSNTKIAESFEIGDNAVWYIKHRVTHKNVTEIKEMELQ